MNISEEIAKDANKEVAKDANKEAAKDANKEIAKDVNKETSKNINAEVPKINNSIVDNITVVSGYWRANNKYGGHSRYDEWFKTTLRINQRYYFFCDKSDIDYIKKFRGDFETIFIPYSLDSFHSSKFLKLEDTKKWTHPTHVPSLEVSRIWHEKIHLMKLAKDADKEKQTEFYVWIDAGICNFRKAPVPSKRLNIAKNALPHNKVCFSGVKTSYHAFSGGVLIMHKNIIDKIHDLYFQSLVKYQKTYKDWRCGSDQFVWTNMVREYPQLFHKLSKGYGQNLTALYRLAPEQPKI